MVLLGKQANRRGNWTHAGWRQADNARREEEQTMEKEKNLGGKKRKQNKNLQQSHHQRCDPHFLGHARRASVPDGLRGQGAGRGGAQQVGIGESARDALREEEGVQGTAAPGGHVRGGGRGGRGNIRPVAGGTTTTTTRSGSGTRSSRGRERGRGRCWHVCAFLTRHHGGRAALLLH